MLYVRTLSEVLQKKDWINTYKIGCFFFSSKKSAFMPGNENIQQKKTRVFQRAYKNYRI